MILTSLSGLFFIHISSLFLSSILSKISLYSAVSLFSTFPKLESPSLHMCGNLVAQILETVSSSDTILFPWVHLCQSTISHTCLFGIHCHCIHLKCKTQEKGIDYKASWGHLLGMIEMFQNLITVVATQLHICQNSSNVHLIHESYSMSTRLQKQWLKI